MHALHKIEIDWEIYQMIELERTGFEEPPHVALRRLLKLPAIKLLNKGSSGASEVGIPWMEDGVIVPHSSRAKMEYGHGKQVFEGVFSNGTLVVLGQSFKTLSAAASALAVTKSGEKTRLNGWEYWKVQFPGEMVWRSLKDLRSS